MTRKPKLRTVSATAIRSSLKWTACCSRGELLPRRLQSGLEPSLATDTIYVKLMKAAHYPIHSNHQFYAYLSHMPESFHNASITNSRVPHKLQRPEGKER